MHMDEQTGSATEHAQSLVSSQPAVEHPPPDLKVKLMDSWIGVADTNERRTIQNRLNQRARRQRQRACKDKDQAAPSKSKSKLKDTRSTSTSTSLVSTSLTRTPIDFSPLDTYPPIGRTAEKSKSILRHLEERLYAEFAKGSPRTDLLLGLTRLNILHAMYANMDVLGYAASQLEDDAQSMFSMNMAMTVAGPARARDHLDKSPVTYKESRLPLALRPTVIQCVVPHHPWIDIIPIPQMRDNVILGVEGGVLDEDALCQDICGTREGGGPEGGCMESAEARETGVIVWREPWEANGWEVTETFVRHWGWTVRGCWDLFRSTNTLRAGRGEKPLFRLPVEHSQ